ncbi:MAG: type I DNA topoisomerase [Desulfovibrio sp.]|jgi:DNA topoisomerase-1|nr:type I DNA topoisomerase [Desulfovibrio sp.]
MKLLILESPGKVKKVQSFLGADWKVVASVGHVRDLPEKTLGVSVPDFTPEYAPTERGRDVLKRLAALVKTAEDVYLATDPDREGEAIAWHLQDALKLKNPKRVTYGSITENVIKAAVKTPRSLDMLLVKAQEARRVLDRLCGYIVSGPLSRVAAERLSAGRVQSPALRLVVERERMIKDFASVTHYGAELAFEGGWKAVWISKPWLPDGAEYLLDKTVAEKAAALRSLEVGECSESESRAAPPAPFTTSSLQQAASNALKFTPKHTMELAQKLYESGAITYMRTDSPNLSAEAITEIRAYCTGKGWSLVDKPRTWKSKDSAQEAHEAIRATHIEIEDAGETEEERALYRLIRIRSLASQLADAVYDVRVLRLHADLDGKEAVFEARGRTLKDSGWKVLLADDEAVADENENDAPDNPVPALMAGTVITASDGKVVTKKTKPSTRYSEAALIRELENRGIGRPATFAAIVDTILKREYIRTEKRLLVPTPLGEKAVDLLVGAFTFADYDFTKAMESALDDIAEGKAAYRDVLAGAYDRLQKELGVFASRYPIVSQERRQPEQTEFTCAACGKPLVHMTGRKKDGSGDYDFFSCSDRKCNASYPNDNGKPGEARKKPEATKFKCKTCGKPLVRRESAKGPFFGCSGYPACKQLYQDKDGKPDFGGKK